MRRRLLIFTGILLGALACTCSCGTKSQPQPVLANYARICVNNIDIRVDDSLCPDTDLRGNVYHPVWVYGHTAAPAVGHRVALQIYTTVKPTGATIARPPAEGGFATLPTGIPGG